MVGIDFGKVISGGSNDGGDVGAAGADVGTDAVADAGWFGPGYLDTPAVAGAEAGVRHLVATLGPEKVFIVSKARCEGRSRTMTWLEHTGFLRRTGLRREHVLFTHEKRDKAAVCGLLGVTAFVDDLPEVLGPMVGAVPLCLLLDAAAASPSKAAGVASERERRREAHWRAGKAWGGAPEGMCPVFRWAEVCAIITGTHPHD